MGVKVVFGVGSKEVETRAKGSFFVGGEGMEVWVDWEESWVVYCRMDRRDK